MLATPTITVPFDLNVRSSSPALSTPHELSAPPRFPHTRAQLTAIARQYRPLDNYEDDNESGSASISSALVARVATLLDAEREEDLKNLIRDSFGPSIDDEEVCSLLLSSTYVAKCPLPSPSSPNTCWISCTVTAMTLTAFRSCSSPRLAGPSLDPPRVLLSIRHDSCHARRLQPPHPAPRSLWSFVGLIPLSLPLLLSVNRPPRILPPVPNLQGTLL